MTMTEDNAVDLRPLAIALARDWIGTPYMHQASAKGQGTDCLGLIRGVWRELYGSEPETPPPYTPDWPERVFARKHEERVFAPNHDGWMLDARGQAQGEPEYQYPGEPLLSAAARHMTRASAPRPGDVLIFRVARDGPARHCGFMSAPDRFIHAYAGRAVLETTLGRWWRERFAGAFALPPAPCKREF